MKEKFCCVLLIENRERKRWGWRDEKVSAFKRSDVIHVEFYEYLVVWRVEKFIGSEILLFFGVANEIEIRKDFDKRIFIQPFPNLTTNLQCSGVFTLKFRQIHILNYY